MTDTYEIALLDEFEAIYHLIDHESIKPSQWLPTM
jgi:hypothetical protein